MSGCLKIAKIQRPVSRSCNAKQTFYSLFYLVFRFRSHLPLLKISLFLSPSSEFQLQYSSPPMAALFILLSLLFFSASANVHSKPPFPPSFSFVNFTSYLILLKQNILRNVFISGIKCLICFRTLKIYLSVCLLMWVPLILPECGFQFFASLLISVLALLQILFKLGSCLF